MAQSRKNMEDLRDARRGAYRSLAMVKLTSNTCPNVIRCSIPSRSRARALLSHLRDTWPVRIPAVYPVFQKQLRGLDRNSEVWVCGWNRPRLLERIAGPPPSSAQINLERRCLYSR